MPKMRKVFAGIALGILVLVCDIFIVNKISQYMFRIDANARMELAARLRCTEFEMRMSEQLTIVRQLVKTRSVKEYLKEPDDPMLKMNAFLDFESFRDSFSSHSIYWTSDVDKVFWNDMKPQYVVDPSLPSEYWYNMTLYKTDEYNFNINYNQQINVVNLWVNAVVRDNGVPIGMVGTGIELSSMLKSMVDGLDSDIEIYLYNNELEITGSRDTSIIEKKIPIVERMPHLKGIDPLPSSLTISSARDGEYLIMPLDLVKWHLVLKVPYDNASFRKFAALPFLISLAIIAVFILLSVTILSIIGQLRILKGAVADLSSGNADLTKRVVMRRRSVFRVFDELVAEVNRFLEKFQGITSEIKDSESKLRVVGRDMNGAADNVGRAISEIIGSINDVGASMSSQESSVRSAAGAVDDVAGNIDRLDKMIMAQAEQVSSASSSVEEMVGNIRSVNSTVDAMADSFGELESRSLDGQSKQHAVNEKISQIEEMSRMLQEANSAIASIASQTNLLAMNAAIEAAHAGDAGKGFAVVSDEIRKLSETSSTQSKTIGEQLQSIQSSIAEVVSASQDSSGAFTAVTDEIKHTNELVQQIKAAMVEQTEGSQHVIDMLARMKDSTIDVTSAARDMADRNKKILRNMDDLQDSSRIMKESMDKMSSGASRVSESGNELSEISSRMRESIADIGNQMSQFTV